MLSLCFRDKWISLFYICGNMLTLNERLSIVTVNKGSKNRLCTLHNLSLLCSYMFYIYFIELCNFIKKKQQHLNYFLFFIHLFTCFLNELPSCTNKICICLCSDLKYGKLFL